MALAEIGAKLSLKGASSFKRDADRAAGSLDKFGRQASQADRKVTGLDRAAGKAGGSLGRMGKAAALGLAGLAAGAVAGGIVVLSDSISKAADLGETLSKVNNVFGKSAGEIRSWSKTAARSFGLSQQEALAAAGQYGDMFKQLGFNEKAAVANSKALVKMSADLGSFHNVDPTDVLDRIGAAMRGEYDSLQALIPNINGARVEQEALAKTGKKVAKELTAQEKVAATLAIIHKDGALAADDFAETSGGLTNQQRILRAQLDDTKAAIGQGLLPVMSKLATYANDEIVPAIQRFVDQFQRGVGPGGEFKQTLYDVRDAAADAWPHIQSMYEKTKTVVEFVIRHQDAFVTITAGVVGFRVAMKSAATWSTLMGTSGAPKAVTGMDKMGSAATRNLGPIGALVGALMALSQYEKLGSTFNPGGDADKLAAAAKKGDWGAAWDAAWGEGFKIDEEAKRRWNNDPPKAKPGAITPRPGGSSQDRNMKPKPVVDVLTPGTASRRGNLSAAGTTTQAAAPTPILVENKLYLDSREIFTSMTNRAEDAVARR